MTNLFNNIYRPNSIKWKGLTSGPFKAHRQRILRPYPSRFEDRTGTLINNVNDLRRNLLFDEPQSIYPRRHIKEILPTRISDEVKKDVYQTLTFMKELVEYHRSNFMTMQDISAVMWMQVIEETISILDGRIQEAASLEGVRDHIMTDAPPLSYVDDDNDFYMMDL